MALRRTRRDSVAITWLSSGFSGGHFPCGDPYHAYPTADTSSHLDPFTLSTTLSSSLDEHDSVDDDGSSDLLALARGRGSPDPSPSNVLDRRRPTIHVLQGPRWPSPIEQELRYKKAECIASNGIGVQSCDRRMCGSTAGHWRLGSLALALSIRRCRSTTYTTSAVPCVPHRLLSLPPFRVRSVRSPRSHFS
jgi:hypothetical protein